MTPNNLLRYTILAGIFATPLIPLMVSGSLFFPFITGKAFMFRVVVGVITALWLGLAIIDKKFRPQYSAVAISVLVFTLAIGIANAFGVNPLRSFWSNYERMEGFVTILHLATYFIVLGTTLNTFVLWKRFWNTTLAISVIAGLYGLFQQIGWAVKSQARVDATLGNSSYLGVYMLVHIFIALFLAIQNRASKVMVSIYCVMAVFFTLILYFTGTRGALIGLVVGLGLSALLVAVFERQNFLWRKIAYGVLGAVVGVAVLVAILIQTPLVKSSSMLTRLAEIPAQLRGEQTSARLLLWTHIGAEGFKERPILGWGQDNFGYVFNKYYHPEMYGQESWFDRTHNVIMDWLIAGGVVGLLAYLSLFATALYMIWKNPGFAIVEKSLFTGLLAAYFIHNFFVFDNLVSYLFFFAFLAYLYSVSEKREIDLFASGEKFSYQTQKMIVAGAVILAIGIPYVVNWDGYAANRTLLKAMATSKPETKLNYLKQALDYDAYGGQEIREQLINQTSQVISSAVSSAIKTEYFNLVVTELSDYIERNPDDARAYVFYGSFLSRVGKHTESIPYLEKALELSPRKQAMHFELGSALINAGYVERAHEVFKNAFELAPSFVEARIFYAVSAIYVGKYTEAIAIHGPLADVHDEKIAFAYFSQKQYMEAEHIWKNILRDNPMNSDARVSLSVNYLKQNKRKEAIEELKKLAELHPQFKNQADQYIKDIEAGKDPTAL